MKIYDYAIIGCGMYGARTAIDLSNKGYSVAIIEKESGPLRKASLNNQARVHNGYHYPRSYLTANGSHYNYQRFMKEYADLVKTNFSHIYAIAKHGSKVNAHQFSEFCDTIGIPLKRLTAQYWSLFDNEYIEEIFLAEEAVIDTEKLSNYYEKKLKDRTNIDVYYNSDCKSVDVKENVVVLYNQTGKEEFIVKASNLFNISYVGTNNILEQSDYQQLNLKAEIAEICLVEVPESMKDIGVTVMDGSFFSCIPFPSHSCHSFTHVKYTPHISWSLRDEEHNAYNVIRDYEKQSRFPFMQKDSEKFMPCMKDLTYLRSIFEVKAIPIQNEGDDGRPILYRIHSEMPLVVSVLGSKWDSVYEWEKELDTII